MGVVEDSSDSEKEEPLRKPGKQQNKENKSPNLQFEEEFLSDCLSQILGVFPEIKLKSKRKQAVKDLIIKHYTTQIKNYDKLKREVLAKEGERKEVISINEATSKKISELESKLQQSELERAKSRSERDNLKREV